MILEQFQVASESDPQKFYVVSRAVVSTGGFLAREEQWQCDCRGWTLHTPRRDCKHITYHKAFGGRPYDPLLASILKVRKAAERKAEKARLAQFMGHPIAKSLINDYDISNVNET